MTATEPSTFPELAAAQAARTIALQMLEERGRGAVLVGVARVDAALEHLLQAVMTPTTAKGDGLFLPDRPLGSIGAFAHSAESASLGDAAHSARLAEVYADARSNPLWIPLETVLAAQPPSVHGALEPALRNYILLITILVAFLEATAQQLSPIQPPVVMGFSGVSRVEDPISAP